MDFETSKLEFSIPAVFEINKKNYKGVIEANEKGLYFLSNDGRSSINYAVDWESAKYTRSVERIRRILFISKSLVGVSIISNLGSLPKILFDENGIELFTKGFQRIKNYTEERKRELNRNLEQNRIKEEAEEERRRIRLKIETEKKERNIRLNKLLAQAEKERLSKLEDNKKASNNRITSPIEDNDKHDGHESITSTLSLLRLDETDEVQDRKIDEQHAKVEWVSTTESLAEDKKQIRERQKRESEARHKRLEALLMSAEEERLKKEADQKSCELQENKRYKECEELRKWQPTKEERRKSYEEYRKQVWVSTTESLAEDKKQIRERQKKESEARHKRLEALLMAAEEERLKKEADQKSCELQENKRHKECEELRKKQPTKEERRKSYEEYRKQVEEERKRKKAWLRQEIELSKEREEQRRLERVFQKQGEHRRLLEEHRKEEKCRRLLEEQRIEEERRRLLEEQRIEEERRRLLEEQRIEEERRRLLEEHRKERERRRLLEEQRREEEERQRRLEEQRRKEEENNRLYAKKERRNEQHFQRNSNEPFGYKKNYHSTILPGVLADDELLKTVETEVNEFEYDNGNYIFRNDCLSEILHDFFQAYVLFQHLGDSIQFQYEYDVMATSLKYYNISSYLERVLVRVVEKALYDFQFDNEILIRILIEISDSCYFSFSSNEEDKEEIDSANTSFERLLELGEKEYNNKSELREVNSQIKEIESQYYELEFGKWKNEKYERIHNYYNNLSEVVIGYIEKQSSPISFYKLKEVFKGLKKNTMRIALNESSIIDLGNRYISLNALHISKRILTSWQHIIYRIIMDSMEPPHVRIIYNALLEQYSDVLQRNYITDANQLFNLLSKLFADEFSFKRPYVALEYQDIVSVKDRIISFVSEKDEVEIEDIQNYARNNYLHIGSLLKLFSSLSDYVLLKNKKTLIASYMLILNGLIPDSILDKIHEELESGKGYKAIRDLECISEFPNIGIKWDEWLIYSIVDKYSTSIYVLTTSKQFKSAIPVVSLDPKLSQKKLKQIADKYSGLENITFDKEVDDLNNLDELIEDYIDLDDIDDLDDLVIDDGEDL